MNSVILIGHLTKDIECTYTATQMAVARFSVGINRGKDKGADFPGCKAFGKTAENMEKYTHKGSLIAVQGHIQTGSYEKDGKTIYTTDVIADRVEFLDRRQTENAAEEAPEVQFSALNEQVPF